MQNQQLIKSLLVFKACSTLLVWELDKLKDTGLYRQNVKNLVNNTTKALEKEVFEIYKLLPNTDEQQGFNVVVELIEKFNRIISNIPLDKIVDLEQILEKFEKGDYHIVEDDK